MHVLSCKAWENETKMASQMADIIPNYKTNAEYTYFAILHMQLGCMGDVCIDIFQLDDR